MRVLVEPVGWVLVVAGLVLLPLPGPGLLLLVAGLVVLAERYDWADRQLRRARAVAGRHAVSSPVRSALSIGSTLVLALAGLLWIWPAWSWLPGGPWAGVAQLVSGLGAFVLLLVERRGHTRRARGLEPELRRSGMLDAMAADLGTVTERDT